MQKKKHAMAGRALIWQYTYHLHIQALDDLTLGIFLMGRSPPLLLSFTPPPQTPLTPTPLALLRWPLRPRGKFPSFPLFFPAQTKAQTKELLAPLGYFKLVSTQRP